MARKISLDDNERAMLAAYNEEDPEAKSWIAPWNDSLAFERHGADAVAATFEGRMAVARHLKTRKLLDADASTRGTMRGYAINDKGREALKQAGS